MPELPEVETIKNELAPGLVGRRITVVARLEEGVVRQPSAAEFRARLAGEQITGIARRGKYLVLSLASGQALVIHLKMSGSLLLKPIPAAAEKYTRAIIELDNATALHFRDPRKFGRMWLVTDVAGVTGRLGPEPLEAAFTPGVLAQRLGRRSAPIKAVLLDQTCLAGVGNMYADEALFAAGIHPLKPAGSLSPAEIDRLYRAICQVLRAGIRYKGASIINYYRPDGQEGDAHHHFRVAHRRGEACPVCGAPLVRLPIRNRGSYFCPRCQRL